MIDDKEKRKVMLDAVKEMSEELHKIEVCRDQIKEIINATSDALGIEKKLIRVVSKLYHKHSAIAYEIESAEIKELYADITAPKP